MYQTKRRQHVLRQYKPSALCKSTFRIFIVVFLLTTTGILKKKKRNETIRNNVKTGQYNYNQSLL